MKCVGNREALVALWIVLLSRLAGAQADEPTIEPDATAGKPRLVVQLAHRNDVTAIATSPDGTRIVTGDSKGHLFLWDAATGKELRKLSVRDENGRPIEAPESGRVWRAGFSPDGGVVIAAVGGYVYVWDRVSGAQLMRQGGFHSLAGWGFSADSRQLFLGNGVWTRPADKVAYEGPSLIKFMQDLVELSISALATSDASIALGFRTGTIYIVNRQTLKGTAQLRLRDGAIRPAQLGEFDSYGD
jgi:WD40 repeat protein